MKHKHYHFKPGSQHHNSKLEEEDIPNIRELRKLGLTLEEIACKYDVKKPLISKICNLQMWTHV